MLGHQLYRQLAKSHDVRVTLRKHVSAYRDFNMFDLQTAWFDIDVRRMDGLLAVFSEFKPDAVVNCVGIVKQRPTAKETIPTLEINALFPHRLAALCRAADAHMIHMSTDCVFSGKKGNYGEADRSDAEDLYGKSKYLGEVDGPGCLTIRTSIIGKELSRKTALLEWFLAQPGSINGYQKAIFSGFTTIEMSRIIEMLLIQFPAAHGIYHISSDPISKYDLLNLIKARMHLPTAIIPDASFGCDRSLNSDRFRREFNYRPPSWNQMIDELCKELTTQTH